jgi:hypothetical protein
MCFCYNYYSNNIILEALNKGVIKISNFSIVKDNKDQAYIIPINSKKSLSFIEDTVANNFDKNEIKRKLTLKADKESNMERQNGEDNIKK